MTTADLELMRRNSMRQEMCCDALIARVGGALVGLATLLSLAVVFYT